MRAGCVMALVTVHSELRRNRDFAWRRPLQERKTHNHGIEHTRGVRTCLSLSFVSCELGRALRNEGQGNLWGGVTLYLPPHQTLSIPLPWDFGRYHQWYIQRPQYAGEDLRLGS